MQPIQFFSPDAVPAAQAGDTGSAEGEAVSLDFLRELLSRVGEIRRQAAEDEEGLIPPFQDGEPANQEDVEFVSLGGTDTAPASGQELFPTGAVVGGSRGRALVVASDLSASAISGAWPQEASPAVLKASGWGQGQESWQARGLGQAAPENDGAAQALRLRRTLGLRLRDAAPELDADQLLQEAMVRASRPRGEALGFDLRGLKGASEGNDIRSAALALAQQAAQKAPSEIQPPAANKGSSASLEATPGQQTSSLGGQDSSSGDQGRSREGSGDETLRFASRSSNSTAQPPAGAPQAGRSAAGAEGGNFSEALAALSGQPRSSAAPEVNAPAGTAASGQTLGGGEPEQVFNQIVRSARLFQNQEGQNFEIRLKPEFLGRVRIETHLSADNRLTTRFLVEDPEVRALLEHRLPGLADRLSEGGVRIQSVEVQSMNSNDAGRSQTDAQQGQQRQAESQDTGRRASDSSSEEGQEPSPEEMNQHRPRHPGGISLVA